MKRVSESVALVSVAALLAAGWMVCGKPRQGASTADPSGTARLKAAYGNLPLRFEENRGQTDARVKFLSSGSGYTLFLTATEAVFSLHEAAPRHGERPEAAVLRLKLTGGNPKAAVQGKNRLPARSNYFLGNDRKKWLYDIPNFARVQYENVYPGVDLVYYGRQRELEYDFVVKPGADPGQIGIAFEGASKAEVDAQGDLVLGVSGGELRIQKPAIYQELNGTRRAIRGGFVLTAANRAGFRVGEYDRAKPLIIDPVIGYSTYLGGSGDDYGYGIAIDALDNAYVVGQTFSTDFPGWSGSVPAGINAFIAKVSADGSTLLYSTILGGSGDDRSMGVVVNAEGIASVAGFTSSPDFPTISGLQAYGGSYDAFIARLDSNGALVQATYLGGRDEDQANAIAVDGSGNLVIAGHTCSADFPITPGAFQTGYQTGCEGFVAKIDPAGTTLATALLFSTYRGGNGGGCNDVALDGLGNIYVTGATLSPSFPTTPGAWQTSPGSYADAFVTKFGPTGQLLVSTYIAGNNGDFGYGIATDSSNAYIYVVGSTSSTNFQTVNALQRQLAGGSGTSDAFVLKLDSGGLMPVYSTYLGGKKSDYGSGITVDSAGNAYVTGSTTSTNFPLKNAIQSRFSGADAAFVSELNSDGSALLFSTYLAGGSQSDTAGRKITLDALRRQYVTGYTSGSGFPFKNGFQSTAKGYHDVFITRIDP